jgi:hypothetical protein
MKQLNATKTLVFFFDVGVKVKEKELWKLFLRAVTVTLYRAPFFSEFVNKESCGSNIGVPV